MRRLLSASLTLLVLAGCALVRPAAPCHGPLEPINVSFEEPSHAKG
jgi:hypothetical protein